MTTRTRRTLAYVLATLAAPALAQTSTAPSPISPAYTLKAGTQLVIVDVEVKDKHGNVVHNLPQSAFTLAEGSRPQQLRNFDEHKALTAAELANVPALPKLPPGEFTNLVTTPQTGALNIILFDVLNSAVINQMYMRSQLIEYLKHARPDSRTAVYALTTQLVQLQGFTSDPKLLLAALEHRGKPKASVERDDLAGGAPNSQLNTVGGEFIAHNGGPSPSEYSPSIAALEAPINDFQRSIKAYTTLDALNQLGRTLAQLPGRKNLIWFSGDFPPEFFPSDTPADGLYASTASLDDEFRDTVNLLSRAQIAVYPIDAQGLRSNQANTADKANGRYVVSETTRQPQSVISAGGPINMDQSDESAFRTAERFSMHQIAEDTGGSAFDNSNDLALGAAKAIDDGANYYTLTYTPSGESTKEGFRHINVKVAGNDYKLSYRRGYFTDHNSRITAPSAPTKLEGSPLMQALKVGSPLPSQVLLRVKAVPVAGPEQDKVLDGNDPNPDASKGKAPFRTYQVETAASVRNMSFTHGADNVIHTSVDIVTDVYDARGTLLNVQSNTIRGAYKPEEMKDLLSGGITFNQRVSVPVKGEYFLRVAVHDKTGGHTGAVEIPVGEIASLPPIADAPAAAALQPVK